MPPIRYRKVPETVDALQYNGSNQQELASFAPGRITEAGGKVTFTPNPASPEMNFVLAINDWVLKDVAGTYYMNSAETFELYYQPGGGP